MRRLFSTLVCSVLALGLIQAPFAHRHEHSDPHDHGGPFHSHAKKSHHHDKPGIASHGPDDDAVSLDVFKLVKNPEGKPLAALPASRISLPLPVASEFFAGITPRAHDPPDLLSSPARAPPA